jgi:hypothetical protein
MNAGNSSLPQNTIFKNGHLDPRTPLDPLLDYLYMYPILKGTTSSLVSRFMSRRRVSLGVYVPQAILLILATPSCGY